MHARLRELRSVLDRVDADRVEQWGRRLGRELPRGRRLLACGNGGSAAEAQHLTAELTGRFRGERVPLSAIALHADTSSVTAIANDYGYREVFARQVRAHGRPGDILVCLSTSGASENIVAAAAAAREIGMTTWALTGEAPSALLAACDDAVRVPSADSATVQEVHLSLIHLLCAAVDDTCAAAVPAPAHAARLAEDGSA
ncbi:SIS domain-containing protein [Streptomonospora nanhaiensis]|uniref:D-sedoheptulose 7-phosphate isomerase n=1 Tax=Streptomonospora nanhaiensis TaxID=1323731 RepID=A0A853BHT5_9ACTN|nr:SIS domain-containing protein [Streptomonospora nanhaiensis]MBV2367224.1 SIS domain-containing protein [Streptomonospora nanhaiensis]MBX9388990.1 SIS domain-containing protein [Streptomonospora nanhaiensis]NYI94096.1 D-sedoheptulose 7-phosphate isomerase [Streptomonospora nanhaiensis]